MPDQTVADFLLERLRDWGVRQVFAYPGDGINAILAAWGRADDDPQFVQSRHEEMSAFEAVGYAKFSGNFGVCMATSGPGAVHLLNGLYDAKLDHVPVVAIVGQTNRSAMGGGPPTASPPIAGSPTPQHISSSNTVDHCPANTATGNPAASCYRSCSESALFGLSRRPKHCSIQTTG
jgi:hypothetical protein